VPRCSDDPFIPSFRKHHPHAPATDPCEKSFYNVH
jgi:hypothetical protein